MCTYDYSSIYCDDSNRKFESIGIMADNQFRLHWYLELQATQVKKGFINMTLLPNSINPFWGNVNGKSLLLLLRLIAQIHPKLWGACTLHSRRLLFLL